MICKCQDFLGFQGACNLHTNNKPLLSLPARLFCFLPSSFFTFISISFTHFSTSPISLRLKLFIFWNIKMIVQFFQTKIPNKWGGNTWCYPMVSMSNTHTHIKKQKKQKNQCNNLHSCFSCIFSTLLQLLNLN